jgi:hypothetical protein
MDRKPVSLHLDQLEALLYDHGGDDRKADLRRDIDTRAREIIDAGGVSSVTVYHPAGFVAWYYENPKPAFGWYR